MSTYTIVEDWDTSRTGESWTGMDLHILRRDDLTNVERAKLVRRTYAATQNRRSKLNRRELGE